VGSKKKTGTWRTLVFWRNILLYFVGFSYIGHFIEMGWTWFCHLVLGRELVTQILAKPYEPYTIYGTGAVLAILIVRPLAAKFKGKASNIIATFVTATLVCSVLEYVSSIILTAVYGYNPYWWYADRPLNLGGHIWIGNSLLFGLLATLFLKLIYPFLEKLLKRGNQVVINVILVIMVVIFTIYYMGQWGLWEMR